MVIVAWIFLVLNFIDLPTSKFIILPIYLIGAVGGFYLGWFQIKLYILG